LVEKGVPLSQVRDLLGHSSIVTTERYDRQRFEAPAPLRRDRGNTLDGEIIRFRCTAREDDLYVLGQPLYTAYRRPYPA
jgi:hypothetical protein